MNIGTSLGTQSGAIWVTAVSLLVFGYAYNLLVNWLHRNGFDDGFTWLEVVFGVAITVMAAGFTIGWGNVALVFIYFVCSGLFMAAGDINRYVQARKKENDLQRSDLDQ